MRARVVEAGLLELGTEGVERFELVDGHGGEGRIETQGLDEARRVRNEFEDAAGATLIGKQLDRVLDRGESDSVHPAAFDAELLSQCVDLLLGTTPFAVEHQQRGDHAEAQHEPDDPRCGVQPGDGEGHDAEHGEHGKRHGGW